MGSSKLKPKFLANYLILFINYILFTTKPQMPCLWAQCRVFGACCVAVLCVGVPVHVFVLPLGAVTFCTTSVKCYATCTPHLFEWGWGVSIAQKNVYHFFLSL
jgi:hypothetical protein